MIVKLWVFACNKSENVDIGFRKKLWAVAPMYDAFKRADRFHRAEAMTRFSRGIIWDTEKGGFRMPFRTMSAVKNEDVSDVWSDKWILPFQIEPLADPRWCKRFAAGKWDVEHWSFLTGRPSVQHVPGVKAAFRPIGITTEAWACILQDYNIKNDDYPEPEPVGPRTKTVKFDDIEDLFS